MVREASRALPDLEELSRVKLLVAAKTQKMSQDLVALVSQSQSASGSAVSWIEEELRIIQEKLDRLEDLESTTWVKIAMAKGQVRSEGPHAAMEGVAEGARHERVGQIKTRLREVRRPGRDSGGEHQCQRSYGHVEKVKLPTFSGKQEEFAEFKTQFRELCQGERYTPVLELAQMKMKLPREALAAITGLRCPDEAWLRLEELYGNRELSIMAALKTLRDFKSSKATPHEQVIEVAMVVQRCRTELSNVDAVHELTGDRESIACIIHALPQTIRDKWYDREVPTDTAKKGEYLLTWLEQQRQNAIRVRLDTMAVKLRGGGGATIAKTSPPAGGGASTDKGLVSSALHAQGAAKAKVETEPSPPGPRIEVKTQQDAQQVADKRRTEPAGEEAGQVSRVRTATLLRPHVARYDAASEGQANLDAPDVVWDVLGVGPRGEAGSRPGERCVSALRSLGPLHP